MAYFPNGTAGGHLEVQCAGCPVGRDPEAPCPVLWVQFEYNYRQLDEGNEVLREAMNWLIDEKGDCQMKKVMEQADPEEPGRKAAPMASMQGWAKARGLL